MPRYVKLTKGTQSDTSQAAADEVVVSDTGNVLMTPGAKPTVNNSATFADLAAATTAHNALLAALRTRGVIGGT
jgi:crotonobetainyl-CoA:carnitine CoA-transferase CaiB-like acyl-CoA transferase